GSAQLLAGLGEVGAVLGSPPESPFTPHASVLVDLGRMLTRLEPERILATSREQVCQRLIEIDEVGIWRLSVCTAFGRDKPHRIGGKAPARHTEGRGNLPH